MPDPQRCCVLALCCPPGSAAQRASLKAWLTDVVLAELPMTDEARARKVEAHLATLPWGKAAADFLAEAGPADTVGGEAV